MSKFDDKPPYNVQSEDLEFLLESIPKGTTKAPLSYLKSEWENNSNTKKRFSRVLKAAETLDIAEKGPGAVKIKEELLDDYKQGNYRDLVRHAIQDFGPYKGYLDRENFIGLEEVREDFNQNTGVSGNTAEAAARTFFDLAQYAGFGEYIKGYGNSKTGFRPGKYDGLSEDLKDRKEKSVTKQKDRGYTVKIETPNRVREIPIEDEFDWEEAEAVIEIARRRWES